VSIFKTRYKLYRFKEDEMRVQETSVCLRSSIPTKAGNTLIDLRESVLAHGALFLADQSKPLRQTPFFQRASQQCPTAEDSPIPSGTQARRHIQTATCKTDSCSLTCAKGRLTSLIQRRPSIRAIKAPSTDTPTRATACLRNRINTRTSLPKGPSNE
jgi:hypothetical protein